MHTSTNGKPLHTGQGLLRNVGADFCLLPDRKRIFAAPQRKTVQHTADAPNYKRIKSLISPIDRAAIHTCSVEPFSIQEGEADTK